MFCDKCGRMLNDSQACDVCNKNYNMNNNSNKNSNSVIVLVLVLVILILFIGIGMRVLYVFYNMRINQKVVLSQIPYANQTIEPGVEITADMISYMEVPAEFLVGNYYSNVEDVVGMCSHPYTMVAGGSIFYTDMVINCDELDRYYDDYYGE